ncbi:hypothetical protein AUJ46_03375 [Candidatus Peregrinibacteria bacterium CG1_02_54_53]|nr:MAG: hypothetical protein AUJ46_03375 [Candidatus Peregrinibacteria bacterium CG1_02_54_53]
MRIAPLLLTGIFTLSVVSPVSAAGDQYADIPPVSPYMERVVRRAREGLNNGSGGGSTADELLKLFWLDQVTGAILLLIDTDLRIVEQERDLRENTACLRVDTLILEGWMERARIRKNDAIEQGRLSEAARLISMQRYLNNRYKALLVGARDPTYVDEEEGSLYVFDAPPYWCCPGKDEEAQERTAECKQIGDGPEYSECINAQGLAFKRQYACVNAGCTAGGGGGEDEDEPCPFSTDYLPPTGAGYGCDLSVLGSRSAPEGIQKETAALQKLIEDRDTAIADVAVAKDTIVRLEQRLGGGTVDLANFGMGTSGNRSHQVKNGCLAENDALPAGITFWERRGPFAFSSNEPTLMPKLAAIWDGWGQQRLPPAYLRDSDELPDGPEKEAALAAENNMLLWLLGARYNAQLYLQKFSLEQAKKESAQIAKTIDAPQRVLNLFAPVRTEVRKLALTVQSPNAGLRKFVRDYASFLRTSCIFRPCNAQLDRILKIVFEDECFPYARGAPIESDVAKRCKDAAGL